MATINLVQGKFESYLDTGALNNGGTVGIYEPDGTYSTLKTHYTSSSLATPNANPLTLDSAGRGTIYYTGDADIRVRDSLGNIIYSQRNASPQTVVSVVTLTGNTTIGASHYSQFIQVSGVGVTLTLSDAGTLTAGWYTDIVNTDSTNTVTIGRATGGDTINGTAANISLLPYQAIGVFVNAAANGFIATAKRTHSKEYKQEEVLTMNGKSLWMAEGADVASATDCNIWTTDGNTVHVTGTTTISDWGTAPQAGATKMVIFDGALQLTYDATTNKLNTGGSNYTTEAGDRGLVYAESIASYIVTIFPLSGRSPVGIASATAVATTSGSSVDFTIPSWAKKITFMLSGVSTSGTARLTVQLGDSGGIETTDYFCAASLLPNGTTPTVENLTTGILIDCTGVTSAAVRHGVGTIALLNASTNTWSLGYSGAMSSAATALYAAGSKSLSNALTTVRFTIGADTFDAGIINVMYE